MIGFPQKMYLNRTIAKHLPDDISLKAVSALPGDRARVFADAGYAVRTIGLALKALISELIEFKPDIVFTDYPAYPAWCAKLYSLLRLHHVPVVAWLLGDWWTEHHALVSTARFRRKLFSPLNMFGWSTGLKFADRILPVSNWLKRIVDHRFPNKTTTVLPRGIDPEAWVVEENSQYAFERPAVGIVQDNYVFPKVKGLLEFSSVVRKMRDINFYIAGGGTYTPLVEKEYSGLPNAHMIGRLSYPEGVRRFYRSTDVYVLASGLESASNTVLEASLCERPVVASRVGGVPERVLEAQTGWTVPNGEINTWIGRIGELVEDENLRRRIGSNGRRFVLDNFSWNIMASRLASIFREELALGSHSYSPDRIQ